VTLPLETAIDMLWGWMPAAQVKEIHRDCPELAALCREIHQRVAHNGPESDATA
jgi:hypothetical protein